jgi:hypothetical protein
LTLVAHTLFLEVNFNFQKPNRFPCGSMPEKPRLRNI